MNLQKLLCFVLMCFGFSLVYAAAQTQPAAGPPAAAPATNPPSAKAAAAPLPDPQTPEEFFARARQLSDLEAAGIPFHLKATYVASGDAEFTGNGTYEEWWQSKDLWRKEATLGDYKYVEIESGEVKSVYASSPYVPLRLRQAVNFGVLSIPERSDKSFKWDMQHQTVNGVDLTVLSSRYRCVAGSSPDQCTVKDFFTSEGMLRIQTKGVFVDQYSSFLPFRGSSHSRNVITTSAGTTILAISIGELEALYPNEPQLSKNAPVPADMHSVALPSRFKDIQPPKMIRHTEPVYPSLAREQGIQGTVSMKRKHR